MYAKTWMSFQIIMLDEHARQKNEDIPYSIYLKF